MASRIFLALFALGVMLSPSPLPAKVDSAEKAAAEAGRPILWAPADGDTVNSMWVTVEGAIPPEMIGKIREIEIFVNAASRGKATLKGVSFRLEGVRLDCLVSGGWNALIALCTGPSLRLETDETKVMLLPGPLRIDAEMSSDAVSPTRDGVERGQNKEVVMRFSFSTPADWTLKLTDGATGKVVRGASGTRAPSCEFRWNGTDLSGAVVADGEYLYELVAASTCGGAGIAHYAGVLTVDTSIPGRPEPIDPADNGIVSPDFHLRWRPVVEAWFYEVQVSESKTFDPHEVYSTGATQLRFAGRADGVFYWRVRAVSRGGTAGPFSVVRAAEVRKVMKPAISMLGVTTEADGLVPDRGEKMRVTYMANDNILVTIRLVTPEGKVVRTLLDGVPRDKGPHVEFWDGRDDANELVTAGAYVATVEAGGTKDVTAFSESRLVMVQY